MGKRNKTIVNDMNSDEYTSEEGKGKRKEGERGAFNRSKRAPRTPVKKGQRSGHKLDRLLEMLGQQLRANRIK